MACSKNKADKLEGKAFTAQPLNQACAIFTHLCINKCIFFQGNIANVITTIQANKFTEEGTQSMQGLMIR